MPFFVATSSLFAHLQRKNKGNHENDTRALKTPKGLPGRRVGRSFLGVTVNPLHVIRKKPYVNHFRVFNPSMSFCNVFLQYIVHCTYHFVKFFFVFFVSFHGIRKNDSVITMLIWSASVRGRRNKMGVNHQPIPPDQTSENSTRTQPVPQWTHTVVQLAWSSRDVLNDPASSGRNSIDLNLGNAGILCIHLGPCSLQASTLRECHWVGDDSSEVQQKRGISTLKQVYRISVSTLTSVCFFDSLSNLHCCAGSP